MLNTDSTETAKNQRVRELVSAIEEKRGRKLYVLYHNTESMDDGISPSSPAEAREVLRKLGHVDKLSVLVESPGGDPNGAYALVRVLRRYADDVEALVVNWAKSGATFVCLGADKIVVADDGQLGPLDVQIPDPRGGRSTSALNAFKSLEFLRQHMLQAIELVVRFYVEGYEMDLEHALQNAQPLVSDMIRPLFGQLKPLELGEARRQLAVGEEYCKRIMQKYSYKHYSKDMIDAIVEELVWSYPSHGFFIGRNELQRLGLNVEGMDDETTELCEELINTVHRRTGMSLPEAQTPQVTVPETTATEPQPATASLNQEGTITHEVQATSSPDGTKAASASGLSSKG